MAMVLYTQGKLDEAMARYEEARGIYVTAYGPNHALVATTLNNMAIVLFKQGMLDEARAMAALSWLARIADASDGLARAVTSALTREPESARDAVALNATCAAERSATARLARSQCVPAQRSSATRPAATTRPSTRSWLRSVAPTSALKVGEVE